jgi:hypothetical protein
LAWRGKDGGNTFRRRSGTSVLRALRRAGVEGFFQPTGDGTGIPYDTLFLAVTVGVAVFFAGLAVYYASTPSRPED